MTAKELIEILQRHDPELEVVINVTLPHSTMGASPCSKISSAYRGIDWESGTIRVHPQGNLVMLNDAQYAEFNKMKNVAQKTRSAAWKAVEKTIDKSLSYDERMEIFNSHDLDKDVHPLFKGNYKKD